MEGSIKELSAYRYSKALEDITASEVMLKESLYKVSINRSYYSIFHAMRAITRGLRSFASSAHQNNEESMRSMDLRCFDSVLSWGKLVSPLHLPR